MFNHITKHVFDRYFLEISVHWTLCLWAAQAVAMHGILNCILIIIWAHIARFKFWLEHFRYGLFNEMFQIFTIFLGRYFTLTSISKSDTERNSDDSPVEFLLLRPLNSFIHSITVSPQIIKKHSWLTSLKPAKCSSTSATLRTEKWMLTDNSTFKDGILGMLAFAMKHLHATILKKLPAIAFSLQNAYIYKWNRIKDFVVASNGGQKRFYRKHCLIGIL